MRILGSLFLEQHDEVTFTRLYGSGNYHTLRLGTLSIHFTDKEMVKLRKAALDIVATTETTPAAPEMEFAPEEAVPAGEEHVHEGLADHPDDVREEEIPF